VKWFRRITACSIKLAANIDVTRTASGESPAPFVFGLVTGTMIALSGCLRAASGEPRSGAISMKKIVMSSVAVLALGFGISGALAQTDVQKTTTTMAAPDGGVDKTTTTTTTSNDGYTQYRRTVTATKHYDAAAFVAPSGYTYTRFKVGDRVPSMLIGSGPMTDYQTYALEAPPAAGLVWIRNGRDALLIDQSTGEVVQTDYGLFN
jgi:Ni/Co efflux regulator RcnB